MEKIDNGNHCTYLKPISAQQPTSPTQLLSPTPTPTPQPTIKTVPIDTNAQILLTVPNLSNTINRKEALDECITHLSRKKLHVLIAKHLFVLFEIIL